MKKIFQEHSHNLFFSGLPVGRGRAILIILCFL